MDTATIPLFSLSRALFSRGMASRLVSGFMLVAVLTVVGKGVSFVKDASVARWFGTSDQMDAFVLAFGFLGFVASVIGGGLPEAFLPFYASLKHRRGLHRAQRLAVQSLLLHAATLAVIALVLWTTAPSIIGLTARSFGPEKQALAASLLREMLPFLVCFGMTHQLATWLRADKHFALAASAPMLIPLTILGFLATGATLDHLVLGTVWGSLLHVSVLAWVVGTNLPKEPVWRRTLFRLREPGVRLAFRDALPYLLAGVVYSSATVVDQAMAAAALPGGAVSVLSYSDKLVGILLALTALPAGEVLFPYFADTVARRDWMELRQQLGRSALLIGGIAIPASLLLCVSAPLVARLLFEHGAFGPADTERVSAVLRIAVFQVPFYIVGTLCSRVAVSMQATRFILLLSVLTMTCNAALNWPLLKLFGAPGIALSTVLVSAISCITVTLYILRQIREKLPGAVMPGSSTEPPSAAPAPIPGPNSHRTDKARLQTARTASSESLEFAILTTSEAFLSLKDEWDDLLEVSAVRTPFMRWDWLELWWHHAADDAQIAICTARDADGHLLALVPLMIRAPGEGPLRHLRELTFLGGGGEIDAEGLEAMARPGREPLIALCWDHALAAVEHDWDIANFSYLDRASPLTKYLTDALDRRGIPTTETNPLPSRYIPLPQDWESYAKTRSKNFRKKLARLNRQAAARFHVEIHLPENASSAATMFRQLLDLHAERWSAKDSLFLQPRTQAFHAELIQRWLGTGRIVLMVMTFDGAPAAANYAFIDHDRLWDYQAGWRSDLADLCPSKLILQANITHAIERGVKEYDFLPGPNPYKISWCPEQREVFDLEGSNPLSMRATIYTSMRTVKRTITRLLPTPPSAEPDRDFDSQ